MKAAESSLDRVRGLAKIAKSEGLRRLVVGDIEIEIGESTKPAPIEEPIQLSASADMRRSIAEVTGLDERDIEMPAEWETAIGMGDKGVNAAKRRSHRRDGHTQADGDR